MVIVNGVAFSRDLGGGSGGGHGAAMERWSVGVLECWSDGVLECWSVGVLECWSVGVLGRRLFHYSTTPLPHYSNSPPPTRLRESASTAIILIHPMIAAAKSQPALEFDTIEDVLSDVAHGKIVIVTDDADRENEGDLVIAAEKVTPDAVNFMAKHGRGLICVPISNERAEQLGLQRMVVQNREMYRTDFTVSVDRSEE